MTKDETLKLALEHIEGNYTVSAEDAIAALREALAAPTTTTETNGGKTGWPPGLLQDDSKGLSKWLSNQPDAKRRVREALAQTEQKRPQNCGTGYCSCIECVMKPSPRAWVIEFENGDEELHFDEQLVGEIHVPLYTHPPQRKPLTDAEIQSIHDTYQKRMGPNEFARAIEAAHGIKE